MAGAHAARTCRPGSAARRGRAAEGRAGRDPRAAATGPLARRVAAAGGRVVSAVGNTSTILAVIGEEPFGYVRYDAQFRKALKMQRSGSPIQILSERQMQECLA